MAPAEIKAKVQDAYKKAFAGNTQWSRSSGISDLLRDLKLYGREASVDFVSTHLDRIVSEAVSAAECRETAMEIMISGFGRSASEGMAQALQDLTALEVETNKWGIKLLWAKANPGLL